MTGTPPHTGIQSVRRSLNSMVPSWSRVSQHLLAASFDSPATAQTQCRMLQRISSIKNRQKKYYPKQRSIRYSEGFCCFTFWFLKQTVLSRSQWFSCAWKIIQDLCIVWESFKKNAACSIASWSLSYKTERWRSKVIVINAFFCSYLLELFLFLCVPRFFSITNHKTQFSKLTSLYKDTVSLC